ncbi:GNAT family N-acetyltransferase [uncultured Albimonas sp.]|uniref:GNAT family N-acetyltransferase n=1 Tax=uncultured Albimonas sp. TaxID=1331701 RepID=UPI0030EEF597
MPSKLYTPPPGLTIRPAAKEEFAIALDWAAAEGWNPGLDDLDAFMGADPRGFWMAWKDGAPVSCISVVRYSAEFGFLGFYIAAPQARGTGLGLAIWEAGMHYLGERTVGLDGVPAQQENYRRSGFEWVGRNIRFTGPPAALPPAPAGIELRAPVQGDLPAILTLDRTCFGSPRDRFAAEWILPAPGVRRRSLVAFREGGVAGFGTIRECRDGFKIGPLFAPDPEAAQALFAGLCALAPAGASVNLDVPEGNVAAVAMAEAAGLVYSFETARMYRGEAPDLPIGWTWGVTTFELG